MKPTATDLACSVKRDVTRAATDKVKRNGGEAPTECRELLCEVIPSEALEGYRKVGSRERVETSDLSPNNNDRQERPRAVELH